MYVVLYRVSSPDGSSRDWKMYDDLDEALAFKERQAESPHIQDVTVGSYELPSR